MDNKDASPAAQDHLVALRAGYRIGHYTIVSVLGEGGFGITYRARDETLRRDVAVKEYLPADLAIRDHDTTIRPRSKADVELYQWGLQRFVDEGRTLAALDAPGVVRVYDFVEANGTAYMVMELVLGESLAHRLDRAGPLPPAELTAMTAHLLQGLDIVHRAGYLHRDIKPANILIRPTGHAVLVDFGAARAARRPGTGSARALTSVYTPGYAPPEQYAGDGSDQGPWTDLYALAATLYEAVTGHAPPDATSRLMSDRMVPAREVAAGRHAPAFLAGIDAALALRREQRPQSVAAWLAMLRGDATTAPAIAPATPAPSVRKPPPPPRLTAATGPDSKAPRNAPGTGTPPPSIQRPVAPAMQPAAAIPVARPAAPPAAAAAVAPMGLTSMPTGTALPPPKARAPVVLYALLAVAAAATLAAGGWFVASQFAPAATPRPVASTAPADTAAGRPRTADQERQAADDAKRRAAETERRDAEEARRKADAEARQREEEARRQAAEREQASAEAERVRLEEAARLRAAEEARQKAEADGRQREEEARRHAAEWERLKIEDQRRRDEARRLAEAERRRADEARAKAETDRQSHQPARPIPSAPVAASPAPVPPAPVPAAPPPPPPVAPPQPQHAADGTWTGQAAIRTHARTGVCEEGFTVRGSASAGNWTGTTSNGLRLAMTIGPDGMTPTRVALDGRDPPAWLGDLRQLTLELRDGCVYRIRFTRQ